MNLRCIYCQTPFTLSRVEMLNGIIAMNERHQNHYDAHCPRCRRANSISRQRMELFFPNWQAAAKELASAPTPAPEPKAEVPAAAVAKTEPLPKPAVAKKAKKPAEKKSAEKGYAPAESVTPTGFGVGQFLPDMGGHLPHHFGRGTNVSFHTHIGDGALVQKAEVRQPIAGW